MVGQAISPAFRRDLLPRIKREFPPPAHDILIAAVQRLADYQDERYATESWSRLTPTHQADRGDCTLRRETARYRALWMSYEDAIGVAGLKTRRSRFERVSRESGADAFQVVKI